MRDDAARAAAYKKHMKQRGGPPVPRLEFIAGWDAAIAHCVRVAERQAGTRCAAHEFTGEGSCGMDIADALRARHPAAGRGEG